MKVTIWFLALVTLSGCAVQTTTARQPSHQMVYAALSHAVPSWETINTSPSFIAWLKQSAAAGSASEGQILKAAFASNDSARVVAIFNAYLAQRAPRQTPLQAMMSTRDLSARADLQVLNGKFPLNLSQIQQPGLSLLSTNRGPTKEEQAALSLYDQLHGACVRAQANWLLDATYGTMPTIMASQKAMFAAEQNHLAALYQGKETFAQFTKAVNALHVGFMNATTQSAQDAYDKTQQQIRSSAPIQTNCHADLDGGIRCTTQQ